MMEKQKCQTHKSWKKQCTSFKFANISNEKEGRFSLLGKNKENKKRACLPFYSIIPFSSIQIF